MLDMGFAEEIDAILEATPKSQQTALFSATMPSRILSIAHRHLKDPSRVTIAREKTAAGALPRVRQVAYLVPRAHKPAVLDRVLDVENPAAALVFCRTRLEVETLVETLSPMAGGRRDSTAAWSSGSGIASCKCSAAARQTCSSPPMSPLADSISNTSHTLSTMTCLRGKQKGSVHRIGRTGRAGRAGTAITLVEPREHRLLRTIEAFTKQRVEIARCYSR